MPPLHMRLPQPPAVFVGREREIAWMRAALARSPVTLVTGWQGVGKSALVEQVFAGSDRRTLACARARGVVALTMQLARALESDEPPNDAEASTAYLVELVEDRGLALVLEDAQEIERGEELVSLVRAFARFGGPRGRLVVLSRERPVISDVAEQTIWLEPLSREQATMLIHACAPSLSAERCHELAAESHGSPLLARELAIGGRSKLGLMLAGLPEAALDLARALAAISQPIPTDSLPELAQGALATLRSHSFIEEVDDLVRLPDVVRAAAAGRPSVDGAAAIAERLLGQRSETRRMQAIEIAATAGADAVLDRALADVDDALVDAVGGARLFQLLGGSRSPEALRVRLLSVARSPDKQGLQWLGGLSMPTTRAERLAYARALFAAGEREAAKKIYLEPDSPVGPAALEAAIGFARSCSPEEAPEGLARLRALELPSKESELRRDVYVALLLYRCSQEAEAGEVARRVHARLHLATHRRDLIARELYTAFAYLRLLRNAVELERVEQLELPFSAERLYTVASVAIETADHARAASAVERLARVARGAPRYAFLVTYLHHRAASHVDFARATALLREMRELAQGLADEDFLSATRCCEWEHSLRVGVWLCRDEPVGAEERRWHSLCATRLRGARPAELEAVDHSREQPLLDAELALATGRYAEAADTLAAACSEAMLRTSVLEAADYASSLAEAVLLWPTPPPTVQRDCVRCLRSLAGEHGLRELDALAAGVELLSGSVAPEPRVLETISEGGPGLASRIARALLDGGPAESLRDRAILAACRTRIGARVATGVRLDPRALRAELPSGARLDLSKHKLLFRLMEALAEDPEGATKERLASRVWSVRSYVPMRDDKRIQVAIKRLRDLLDEQALPPIVATTPTGYVLKIRG